MQNTLFRYLTTVGFLTLLAAVALSQTPTPTPEMSNEDAINAVSEMQKKDAAEANKLLVQANVLIAQGKDRDALPLLDQARALNGNDTRILASGAIALVHLGNLDKAEQVANIGVNSLFAGCAIYDALGQVQEAKKNLPAAIMSFGKAIEKDASCAVAYYHRGIAKADSSDNAGALGDYTKAIQIDPKLEDAYFKRGFLYIFVLNEPAKGIADFDKFLTFKPNYSYAYSNRASGYFNLKQFDRSLADNNKAIQIWDKNKFAFANRGLTYAQQGKYDLARADYQKALALDPNFNLVKDRLADLEKNNSTAEGLLNDKTDLKKLGFKIDPKPTSTPDSTEVLKKLGLNGALNGKISYEDLKKLSLNSKNQLGSDLRGDRLALAYSSKFGGLLAEIKVSKEAMAKFTNEQLSSQASCTEMRHGYDLNVQLDDLLRKKKMDADTKWLDLTPLEYDSVLKTLAADQELFTKYSGLVQKYCGVTVRIPPPVSGMTTKPTNPNPTGKKYADAMAAFNAGMEFNNKGDIDNALEAFREAVAMDPKFVVAINNVGAMFAKKNELVKALYAYMQASAIDRNFEITQNNEEGIVRRIKEALSSGTLKLSKEEFTSYYTVRTNVYSRMVAKSDEAALAEVNRRSNTLDCSKLQAAYETRTKFDTFLRNLKDNYERGNTTYPPKVLTQILQLEATNKQGRTQWFDKMHDSGCIVRGFYPEF